MIKWVMGLAVCFAVLRDSSKRGTKALEDVLGDKTSEKLQKLVHWRVSTWQKRNPHSGCRGMPKPGNDAQGNGQEVANAQRNAPLERRRHHQPNAQLKKEKHSHR